MKDIVFDICQRMLANSSERSYKRLNPALRGTLANCIAADLPFQPTTFRKIYNELRGGWFFGDGAGSHIGEGFYNLACEHNHASAQQSFEKFAGRPACLWEENAKPPLRLHVGAQFTWQGYYVTVTSMRKDDLVACTYKDSSPTIRGLKVGAVICYDPEYITEVFATTKTWATYAMRQLRIFERLVPDFGIPPSVLHLWPDKALATHFPDERDFLQAQWNKISQWPK